MPETDWSTISERDFNALVNALFLADYANHPTLEALPVEGRGGDRGIDILIRTRNARDPVEVIQLKWFRDGMSGGHRSRRRQVQDSFDRARRESPTRSWRLVIPVDATNEEREFVEALGGDAIRTRIDGATSLTLMLGRHPELDQWHNRSAFRSGLELVGRESSALTRPGDLAAEAARLHARAQARSPYWGTRVTFDDHGVTERLYARRPDAPIREPLLAELALCWTAESETLRREFDEVLAFGGAGPVVIPGQLIVSYEQRGPEWFAGSFNPGSLSVESPADSAGQRVSLSAASDLGQASVRGVVESIRRGNSGATLTIEVNGGLTLVLKLPRDPTAVTDSQFTFAPPGHSASDVRRVYRFLDVFDETSTLGVDIEGVGAFNLNASGAPDFGIDDRFRQLVDDLALVEREADVLISCPDRMPEAHDRIVVRLARMMLDGLAGVYPNLDGFSATLVQADRTQIAQMLREPGAIVMQHAPGSIDVLGTQVWLPDVRFYIGGAEIVNREAVAAALASDADEVPLQIRALPGQATVMHIPSIFSGEEFVVPSPWGIDGIPESEYLSRSTPSHSGPGNPE